jgi:hypothetical protein
MKKSYIIITTLALLVVGVGTYFVSEGTKNTPQPLEKNRQLTDSETTNGNPLSEPKMDIESLDTADWMTYRSDKYGYEVKYPNGAITEFLRDGQRIEIGLDNYLGVPKNLIMETKNNFGLGMAILITDAVSNPDNLSIEKWVWTNEIVGQAPEPDSVENVTFSGMPAYYIVQTYPVRKDGLYGASTHSIYFFYNSDVYRIIDGRPPDSPTPEWKSHPYYKYLEQSVPITEAIVRSFRFTE